MIAKRISLTASNYTTQKTLGDRFMAALQKVLDNGGQIISITRDENRVKTAFVVVPDSASDETVIDAEEVRNRLYTTTIGEKII